MDRPLFSIVLPTKGRPALAEVVVRSVLTQDHGSFELIVVDNDDDEATYAAIAPWRDDERLRYVRTGGLDMVENWRVGLAKVAGTYLLLADSKTVFYPGALASVERFFQRTADAEVLVWNYDFVVDWTKDKYFVEIESGEDRVEQSSDVLERFLLRRMHRPTWATLPRGLCCAISMEVVRRVEAEFGGNFFEYHSPDLVAALKILSCTERTHYLGDVLSCVISTKVSNGRNFATRQDDGSYFKATGGAGPVAEVRALPLKNRRLASNLIADDIEVTLGSRSSTPYYETWHDAYVDSLFREIGNGIGRSGLIYTRQELREVRQVGGWTFKPYVTALRRIVRARGIVLFDSLPGWARALIQNRRPGNRRGHPSNISEIALGADVYTFVTDRHRSAAGSPRRERVKISG